MRIGLRDRTAELAARAAPVAAVVATIAAAILLDLRDGGVATVGAIPSGLPPFDVPAVDLALWRELWLPALLISIIGFVESVSVAQTLAARRRQRIVPDQELEVSEKRAFHQMEIFFGEFSSDIEIPVPIDTASYTS